MANVYDTAKYILEQMGPLSTMKLQKLCYYAQAWSLVWDDNPLFNEEIQAWENGPVCPALFNKTRGQFKAYPENETGGEGNLTDEQKETIDRVIEHYGPHDAQWLSQLTHAEKPWREARVGLQPGEISNRVITQESMSMYYGGL